MTENQQISGGVIEAAHTSDGIDSRAGYSPCLLYRYFLVRRWGERRATKSERIAFIGLNPSTATEVVNDPTVRRCIGYARDWGFREFVMLNVFAYRATDPRRMKQVPEPIGPETDAQIRLWTRKCRLVIACWGTHAVHLDRHREILQNLQRWGISPQCLGRTKSGLPRHPLYLRRDAELMDM